MLIKSDEIPDQYQQNFLSDTKLSKSITIFAHCKLIVNFSSKSLTYAYIQGDESRMIKNLLDFKKSSIKNHKWRDIYIYL